MGRLGGSGRAGGAPAYNASKGAVRVLTEITAVEYAKDNIRCNSIHPGPIDTQMIREGHVAPDAMAQQRLSWVPLGRLGTVDDIAYGVLYLASDEAAFVTGSKWVMDGGFIAQ
jgi:NAD(P)-dependent dehydrogenase (short-subunit alcohol dehydrogenase family)